MHILLLDKNRTSIPYYHKVITLIWVTCVPQHQVYKTTDTEIKYKSSFGFCISGATTPTVMVVVMMVLVLVLMLLLSLQLLPHIICILPVSVILCLYVMDLVS
ncbi:hypothetical protein Hanom_Chr08g00725801 [Helianthus anomalus]